MIKAVIFDVDDTLYSYMPAFDVAFPAVCRYAQEQIGIPAEVFASECDRELNALSGELSGLSAVHERTLRFLRVLEKFGKPLRYAPILDDLFWNTFLETAVPEPGILACFRELKEKGFKIGIGTNMTLKWQLKKVEALGLLQYVDFFVASEESGADKPAPALFQLCAKKAGCAPEECLFVGDSIPHDIRGAENAGMHFLWYTRGRENTEHLPAIDHFDALVPLLTKKALFLDLDGTLLNDRKEITTGNRDALVSALKEGHRVIIATGRALLSAVRQAEKLGLTGPGCYVIAYNGGTVYDIYGKKEVFRRAIPNALADELFDLFASRGIHVQSYDRESVLVRPGWEGGDLKRYLDTFGLPYRVIGHSTLEPCKMLAIRYGDPDALGEMEELLREAYCDRLDCFRSDPQFLEIVPQGVNKGDALRRMCGILGIPMENTVAVGDGENDLSMLRAAHVGVAMQNAPDAVKAHAGYVTGRDNNHDGVAEVVEKFLLS